MTPIDTKISTNRTGNYYKKARSGHKEEGLTVYPLRESSSVSLLSRWGSRKKKEILGVAWDNKKTETPLHGLLQHKYTSKASE